MAARSLAVALLLSTTLGATFTGPQFSFRQSDNPPLRGNPNLAGYDPSNTIVDEDTTKVDYELAPGQTDDATLGQHLVFDNIQNPQPIRGAKGGTDPGPRNDDISRLNSDLLAPPGTDHGQTINAKWPMALSKTKLGKKNAGWARQQNLNVMPDAKLMAGVNMRLEPGAYRELHWHVASEWALMLNGTARIQAVDENGQTFIDDVSKGDVWFFPAGVPHSIQGLKGGCEFLLIFDDGAFSEDNTFLASEVFAHNPKSVLSKNLNVPVSAFDNIPPEELFIFPGRPAPEDIEKQNVTGSAGPIPKSGTYSFHWSEQPAHQAPGGSVKILDPLTFPVAKDFSAALVTVKPGAIREIHWHPNSDEWTFFIAGKARATLFTPPNVATTYDYSAGDVAYFPQSNNHYVENIGDTDVIFIEVLQADHFSDIALGQWLGLTAPQIVEDTLNLSPETVSKFPKDKPLIIAGSTSNEKREVPFSS